MSNTPQSSPSIQGQPPESKGKTVRNILGILALMAATAATTKAVTSCMDEKKLAMTNDSGVTDASAEASDEAGLAANLDASSKETGTDAGITDSGMKDAGVDAECTCPPPPKEKITTIKKLIERTTPPTPPPAPADGGKMIFLDISPLGNQARDVE